MGGDIHSPIEVITMTAIQMLEKLAADPSYKRDFVSGKGETSSLAIRAQSEISDLLKQQSKIWCALLPAEDDAPDTSNEPRKDSDDDAVEDQRSDN